jgi:hypothetical protein
MGSFDKVNYSIRPNKTIERALAFEGVRLLQAHTNLENVIYVGFGSVWFTDYLIAHKSLGIRDMISMEGDAIGFSRAKFNKPFGTCNVMHGFSGVILPRLLRSKALKARPWLVWLDYDYGLTFEMVEEIRLCIENLPADSVFLITVSGKGKLYGPPEERPALLRRLLGKVVPRDLTEEDVDEGLPHTLADLTLAAMNSMANASGRPGGFKSAFRMIYTDTSTMITVGGILPARGAVGAVERLLEGDWPAFVEEEIEAPHLTIREAAVLQSELPMDGRMTRKMVRDLGFDLSLPQIRSFQKYYRYYPAFAQIVTS